MKKHIVSFLISRSIPAFIFAFLLTAAPAFADTSTDIDGITFGIKNVSFGEWAAPRYHMVNDLVDHAGQPETTTLSYIAISYAITNGTGSKKIDLDGKTLYALFDEFGNRYRPMRKPGDFKSSVLTVSKNFPSLYPGEQYGETLFFEAPIAKAKELKLSIEFETFHPSRPIELTFSRDAKDPSPAERPRQEQPVKTGLSEISIAAPQPGIVWDQGQSARVEVHVSGAQIPKKIIMIALDNTFPDPSPTNDNTYDLNVPFDQPPGEYILNVIAQWPDGSTSSSTLKFYVKDATPLGIL